IDQAFGKIDPNNTFVVRGVPGKLPPLPPAPPNVVIGGGPIHNVLLPRILAPKWPKVALALVDAGFLTHDTLIEGKQAITGNPDSSAVDYYASQLDPKIFGGLPWKPMIGRDVPVPSGP